LRFGGFERQRPAGDRGRHGERGEGTARRNGLEVAIKLAAGIGAGAARGHECAHTSGRLAHQPEAVAADVVHVRIDRGDHRRHRHHGFERVAALGQHRAPGLDGGGMRRADHALAMSGSVEVHER